MRVPDDGAHKRRKRAAFAGAIADECEQMSDVHVKGSQAPTSSIDGPSRVRLVGIDRINIARPRNGLDPSCPGADRSPRYEGEASLFMRVHIVGIVAESPTQQFSAPEIIGAPEFRADGSEASCHRVTISVVRLGLNLPLRIVAHSRWLYPRHLP